MGYEIKYDDISNVRNFADVTIDLWKNQLDDIQNICQNMKDSTQMEGQQL